MKINCWEFKKCGRQPGGANAEKSGICPATNPNASAVHDGINGGSNGGRHCWKVVGTMCGGKGAGGLNAKPLDCITCCFFKMVKQDEGESFTP